MNQILWTEQMHEVCAWVVILVNKWTILCEIKHSMWGFIKYTCILSIYKINSIYEYK